MNLRKPIFYTASALLLVGCSATSKIAKAPFEEIQEVNIVSEDPSEESLKTWPHTDLNSEAFPGMNLKAAYKLLEGLKPTNVIVGIIDSGIDINHEDLKEVIWTNPNEIPNNGIDDDNNGYIDDIHGWNFLGNINQATLEMVRVLQEGESNPDFAKAKKEYDEEIEKTQQNVARYEQLLDMINKADASIAKELGNEEYTLEDLESINTEDTELQQYIAFVKQMLSYSNTDMADIKEEIQGAVDHYKRKLEYHLNLDFYPRKDILKDDENDISKTAYGNNNVIGPDLKEALHGTHVAGIVGAKRNNGIGMNGVADNVSIMCVRAVPDGDEYDKDIALAIRYAVDNGAKVLNTSFGKGYSPHTKWVHDAIKYAADHDVLIVNAAGNDGKDIDREVTYPNDDINGKEIADNMITVGALSFVYGENLVASFSNYGQENVDIFAPGVQIWSTVPDNEYKFLQGTSMASPEVAGLAALIRSYFPKLTASQVKKAILQSGLTPTVETVFIGNERDKEVSFTEISKSGKMINAYNAVILAAQMSK